MSWIAFGLQWNLTPVKDCCLNLKFVYSYSLVASEKYDHMIVIIKFASITSLCTRGNPTIDGYSNIVGQGFTVVNDFLLICVAVFQVISRVTWTRASSDTSLFNQSCGDDFSLLPLFLKKTNKHSLALSIQCSTYIHVYVWSFQKYFELFFSDQIANDDSASFVSWSIEMLEQCMVLMFIIPQTDETQLCANMSTHARVYVCSLYSVAKLICTFLNTFATNYSLLLVFVLVGSNRVVICILVLYKISIILKMLFLI